MQLAPFQEVMRNNPSLAKTLIEKIKNERNPEVIKGIISSIIQ
jgi:hypothetical protein